MKKYKITLTFTNENDALDVFNRIREGMTSSLSTLGQEILGMDVCDADRAQFGRDFVTKKRKNTICS